MAKYEGTYACGHDGVVNVIGKMRDRQRKIDYDQVYVGQIIQTEDGPEKVIAVDEQGSYVTEVLEQ